MTDEAARLAAIRDRPDDDTPRLVYADWLDDNDRPERAAFIRAQIEIARPVVGCKETPSCLASNRHREIGRWCPACWPHRGLLRTEDDLYAAVGCDGIPVGIGSAQVTWVRGFVEACEVSADAWVRHGDELLAAHPVRRVRLTTWPDRNVWPVLYAGMEFKGDGLMEENPEVVDRYHVTKDRWPEVRFYLPPAPGRGVVGALAEHLRRTTGLPVYARDGDPVRDADGREGMLVGEIDGFGRGTIRFGLTPAPPSPPG